MDNNTSGVIECAKEELEILELQHPNRFDYLKMDLKDFISDFQSSNNSSISTCPSVHTQESSNRKKRKKGSSSTEDEESRCRSGASGFLKKRSKTEAILQRARQCLLKIQQFKTSF